MVKQLKNDESKLQELEEKVDQLETDLSELEFATPDDLDELSSTVSELYENLETIKSEVEETIEEKVQELTDELNEKIQEMSETVEERVSQFETYIDDLEEERANEETAKDELIESLKDGVNLLLDAHNAKLAVKETIAKALYLTGAFALSVGLGYILSLVIR